MTIRDEIDALPKEPKGVGIDASHQVLAEYYFIVAASARAHREMAERLLRDTLGVADFIFACFPALTEVLTKEQIESIGRDMGNARAYLAKREAE